LSGVSENSDTIITEGRALVDELDDGAQKRALGDVLSRLEAEVGVIEAAAAPPAPPPEPA
jgi:hypothetical protein